MAVGGHRDRYHDDDCASIINTFSIATVNIMATTTIPYSLRAYNWVVGSDYS